MADPSVQKPGEWERHVSRRCPRNRVGHMGSTALPIPCPECYSIESFWRRIPYEPDSRAIVADPSEQNAREMIRRLIDALRSADALLESVNLASNAWAVAADAEKWLAADPSVQKTEGQET